MNKKNTSKFNEKVINVYEAKSSQQQHSERPKKEWKGKKIKINKHQSDQVLGTDRAEGVFDFNMHISGK